MSSTRDSARWARRGVALVCSCALAASFTLGPGIALSGGQLGGANSAQALEAAAQNGWNADKTKYYANGQAVCGPKKIGTKWYAFSSKGNRMAKNFTYQGEKLYCNEKGYLEARLVSGSLRYANGKAMSKADAADYKCVIAARKVVKSICKPSQTKAQKLETCFKWVMKKYYAIHRVFPHNKTWPATYAMDHFKNRNGDCHADAAAFAYLAYAVGYTKVYCCTDSGVSSEDNHAWTEVNGYVYDPLFAQSKSYSKYYKCSYRSYYTSTPSTKVAIPFYNAKNAGKAAATSSKRGLVKKSGSYYYYGKGGKMARSAWVKVGKYKYYFKSSGKAAVGSAKIKGKYWVFTSKGRLSTGKKTHFTTVAGQRYLTAASGRAKSGWTADGKKRYSPRGLAMKGVWVCGGKFFAFDPATGIYNKALTSKLRSSCVVDGDVTALKELLGQPKKATYVDACRLGPSGLAGKDGILEYANFYLYTFLDEAGAETYVEIESR